MTDALDRRTFLRRVAAGAAALSSGVIPRGLTSFAAHASRTGAPQKIIVIGAGMAGLSAALQLTEGGAMQVFDSHSRVQRYIQQFGLETDAIHPAPGTSLLHVKGHRVEMKPG